MTFFGKCQECHRRCIFATKRQYFTKDAGWILSQKEQCGRCYRGISKIIRDINGRS